MLKAMLDDGKDSAWGVVRWETLDPTCTPLYESLLNWVYGRRN